MSTPTHRDPRARARYTLGGVLVIGFAGLIGLSACSSGQITQTSQKVSAIAGVNQNIGEIAVRDARISPAPDVNWPKGSDIAVSLTLVNGGKQGDKLIKASSTQGDEVKLAKGKLPLTELPSASPTPTPTPTATPTASPSPSPTQSPGTSEEVVEEPKEFATVDVPLAPHANITLTGIGEQPQYLVIVNAKKAVKPGELVSITLTFEQAGEITLELPVGPPSKPRDREPLKHEGVKEEH